MRLRRVFVIAAIVVVVSLAAAVFVAFSDFGSEGEPVVVNGIRLRRYVSSTWSPGTDAALAGIGTNAIPWLIKGLDTKDSSLQNFKARVWRTLPKTWQMKWRNRAPIDPGTLRVNCVIALGLLGPEAVAAVPKLIEVAKSDPDLFAQAVALNALASMASDSPQAKAFLIESLRDGDTVIKSKVASAFLSAHATPVEAVPLLLAQLENYSSPGPLNEMMAISVCGPEAAAAGPLLVPYITRGMGWGNALSALRATGTGALVAVPRLLEVLEERDVIQAGDETTARLKPGIFAVLARLGPSGGAALPALTNGLSDSNAVVRALAAAGIANITGDTEFAVRRLVEQLEKRQRTTEHLTFRQRGLLLGLNHRHLAALLLGELGPPATNALPSLKRALGSRDIWLPAFAAEAIWRISKDTNAVLSSLIAGLKEPRADRRMLTLNVLAEVGPAAAPAVPAIRDAMQSELKVRCYGYVALQRINGRKK